MPKVVTVAHQKGGVGKTTLLINLAAAFANGLKVGVYDTDVQGCLSSLDELPEGVTLRPAQTDLKALQKQPYDVVLVDTPPYLSTQLPALFSLSDFVLVPTKAGFFDVMAIRATIAFLNEASKKRPGLRSGVVLNVIKHRTAVTAQVKDILTGYGVPVLETMVTDRVSYTRSPLIGGVFNSEDEKAKEEMAGLADEILHMMGI
jgi:chromosome partitioning protein